jgi:hypothetical protein
VLTTTWEITEDWLDLSEDVLTFGETLATHHRIARFRVLQRRYDLPFRARIVIVLKFLQLVQKGLKKVFQLLNKISLSLPDLDGSD